MITASKYRYIEFVRVGEGHGKPVWACRNKRSDDTLGMVEWYPPWRQFTFGAWSEDIVFNKQCLLGIADFLERAAKGEVMM